VRNGIVVVVIVNVTFAWGEYTLASILMNDFDTRTLPVFIAQRVGGMAGASAGPIGALYVLSIAPCVLAFGIAQHWYMKGLQEGALTR
jgi:ABC-type glycerol-3-phosphate transport system permease component